MKEVDRLGRSVWKGFTKGWSPKGLLYMVDELGSLYWPSVCGTPHPIPELFDLDAWEGEPTVKLHSVTVRIPLSEPVNIFFPFK